MRKIKSPMNYKKLLIQQQTYNGTTYTNVGSVIDTYESFGILCQEFPFKYLPEMKDLAKRDWYDEDGEDVYIPTDGTKAKAYDLEVKFLYSGAQNLMYDKISSFVKFITGRNANGSSLLAIYDEYTGVGKRGVYVQEIPNELYDYNDVNIDAYSVFKVKFRITDPVTDITLAISSGSN